MDSYRGFLQKIKRKSDLSSSGVFKNLILDPAFTFGSRKRLKNNVSALTNKKDF